VEEDGRREERAEGERRKAKGERAASLVLRTAGVPDNLWNLGSQGRDPISLVCEDQVQFASLS